MVNPRKKSIEFTLSTIEVPMRLDIIPALLPALLPSVSGVPGIRHCLRLQKWFCHQTIHRSYCQFNIPDFNPSILLQPRDTANVKAFSPWVFINVLRFDICSHGFNEPNITIC